MQQYEARRSVKMAAIGAFFIGPLLHVWYGTGLTFILDRFLPGIFGSPMTKILSKTFPRAIGAILFDQTLCSTFGNGSTIFLTSFIDNHDVKTSATIMRNRLWECQLMNWKIWPAAQLINFSIVPLRYRVLFASCVGYVFNIYLSWISNRTSDPNVHKT
jgi:protein Mpv17